MLLAILCLLTALTISGVAIYYSVIGLTAIFSAAAIPIMIMGVSLEVAKLVATVWLHRNWKSSPILIKSYLATSVLVLMLITSMGIFGFLSKAHNDQTLVSGDVQSRIAIYDEKIATAKENIETSRKQLRQLDSAVDEVMARSKDEKGADKANQIRRSQAKERALIAKEIETNQKLVAQLNQESAPIRAEIRKVEAEVGPIKYIAAFFYGNTDANILERAVTWVIMTIIFVFDPLAVVLLLASQYSFREYFHNKKDSKMKDFFEKVDEPAKPTVIPENDETLPPVNLDEVKQKLEKFNEALAETQVIETPVFTKMDTTIKGFDVPKVEVAQSVPTIQPLALDVEPTKVNEEELGIENIGIEQWNKMIEAAEKEVTKAEKTIKMLQETASVEVVEKHENGLFDNRDLANDPKYKIFPELVEQAQGKALYVQNEEQTQSNLWQETTSTISQTVYQEKAKEATIKELVQSINEGRVKVEDLTDEETKAVEEYLKKENNDGQDNTDKSA